MLVDERFLSGLIKEYGKYPVSTNGGNFTANFKELPPPLPAEYWATLFNFVLTTGLGAWLIPSFVRWTRTKANTK